LLILRPQPGAARTAQRAAALGLQPVVAPLFAVAPLHWDAPEPSGYDALLLTSANAARFGGRRFTALPVYAVGEATAAAARDAGYGDVRVGPSDGAAAAAMMGANGVTRALHLCGRDHVSLSAPGVTIDRRCVYAAEPVSALPEAARQALAAGAVVLLHSARAADRLAALVAEREAVRIAAISAAAAAAAGEGWAAKAVAAAPRDEALLELAAQLCQNGGDRTGQMVGKHGI
jgi:uroporphyrinogen-III synthase